MTISIITPTFNSAKTIERTLSSVVGQNYTAKEQIIIDGNSQDETIELVRDFLSDREEVKIVAEPDQGIYDAMNKGIKLATGEVISILNSDDLYNNDQVLSAVATAFSDSEVDIVYGDLVYFSDQVDKITRIWRAGEYDKKKLKNGWTIPHPVMFVRRRVYDKFGLYRTDLKLAADYEFILRVLISGEVKVKYLPQALVKMYAGGSSGQNIKQRIKGWRELRRAWQLNHLKPPRLFICRRVGLKLKQLIVTKKS